MVRCQVIDCGTVNFWDGMFYFSTCGRFCLFQIFGSYTLFLLHSQWKWWHLDQGRVGGGQVLLPGRSDAYCHVVSETCHFHGWPLLCSVATSRYVCGLLFWCGLLQSTFKSLKSLQVVITMYEHWHCTYYAHHNNGKPVYMVKQFKVWLHSINYPCMLYELGEPKTHLCKFLFWMHYCVHVTIYLMSL